MRVALPELELPARLILDPEQTLSDEQYEDFCMANPEFRIERTSKGEIVILPPAGWESSFRSGEAYAQLRNWVRQTQSGQAFDSSAEYMLPNGAALSPDASWVSSETLKSVSPSQRRRFPHLCPEFVIEVMSPSDRLPAAKAKMAEWIESGAQLGWLIDADHRTVYVYRQGQAPEVLTDIHQLSAGPPLEGFVLQLDEIWAAL